MRATFVRDEPIIVIVHQIGAYYDGAVVRLARIERAVTRRPAEMRMLPPPAPIAIQWIAPAIMNGRYYNICTRCDGSDSVELAEEHVLHRFIDGFVKRHLACRIREEAAA